MFNFSFSGKAKRSEYWMVTILWFITILISALAAVYIASTSKLPLFLDIWAIFAWLGSWIIPLLIIGLCCFFAELSVTVRRCNDIGMSPFWSLLIFVPYIGFGAMLLFGILGSDDATPQSKGKRNKLTPDARRFIGEKHLSNDGYKLYLLDLYSIQKNDALNKFICKNKIFNSVDEALRFADAEESEMDKGVAEQKTQNTNHEIIKNKIIRRQFFAFFKYGSISLILIGTLWTTFHYLKPSYKNWLLERSSRLAIEAKYESAGDFRDGLAPVKFVNGYWGYINKQGKIIIPSVYSQAGSFSEGLAPVVHKGDGNLMSFINVSGETVIPPRYVSRPGGPIFWGTAGFSDGLAPVALKELELLEGNIVGYINKNGDVVLSTENIVFGYDPSFKDGLACFRNKKFKYGYINTKGDVVIDPIYSGCEPFSDGVAFVLLDRGHSKLALGGFIDKTGTPITKFIYSPMNGRTLFSDGMAYVVEQFDMGNRTGYINKLGEMVLENQFRGADEGDGIRFGDGMDSGKFSNGLATATKFWLKKDGSTERAEGFINKEGEPATKFIFTDARPFSDGMAAVRVGNKWGYISRNKYLP